MIIFESTLAELEDSNLAIKDFKDKNVKVTGTITEYGSSMEIILSSGNSIQII